MGLTPSLVAHNELADVMAEFGQLYAAMKPEIFRLLMLLSMVSKNCRVLDDLATRFLYAMQLDNVLEQESYERIVQADGAISLVCCAENMSALRQFRVTLAQLQRHDKAAKEATFMDKGREIGNVILAGSLVEGLVYTLAMRVRATVVMTLSQAGEVAYLLQLIGENIGKRQLAKEVRFVENRQANTAVGPAACCVVCMERPPSVMFVPCGHSVTCYMCASRLVAGPFYRCPYCREGIRTYCVRFE